MANIEQRLTQKGIKITSCEDYKIDCMYDEKSDNYFNDIESIEEYYEDNISNMPKYVYGCKFESVKLDTDWIIEQAIEEHAEEIEDKLNGIDELIKAIDKFNDDNKDVGSYYDDIMTIVKL